MTKKTPQKNKSQTKTTETSSSKLADGSASLTTFIYAICLVVVLLAVATQYYDMPLPLSRLKRQVNPVNGTFKIVGNSGVGSLNAVLLPNGIVMSMSRTNGGGPLTNSNAINLMLTAEYDTSTNKATGHLLASDIWCSSGALMPDGRLLSVGGSSSTAGFHAIRFWSPQSKPGVPGKNSWLEKVNGQFLATSAMRWYPTAIVLADGRILVIQGDQASGIGGLQTNVEIFPQPPGCPSPNCLIDIPFLSASSQPVSTGTGSDIDVLYPFAAVLPSGNLFLFAGKMSAILDTKSAVFAQTKAMPILRADGTPGSTDANAPSRSYSLSAGVTLMPLDPATKYRALVMICGGSFGGRGADSVTISSCGVIGPEDAVPQWDYSDSMPVGRTMPELLLLPDETILIVNGAQTGYAGYNGARLATLDALIYDPKKPAGSRFTSVGQSTIPRVYHSTALLLQNGTVWISGSLPNERWNTGGTYPYEYRVELFTPPYLTNQRPVPVITAVTYNSKAYNYNTAYWSYQKAFTVSVTIPKGLAAASKIRVVVINGGFHTHAVPVQQRLVVLVQSAPPKKLMNNNYMLSLVTPPSAGVAPPGYYMLFVVLDGTPSASSWIQIGGDPANLKNWYKGY